MKKSNPSHYRARPVAIEPDAFLEYLGLRAEQVPHTVVLCFQGFAVRELVHRRQLIPFRLGTRKAYGLKGGNRRWAVLEPHGIGAPAAALTFEELVALGVRQVLTVGGAGALQSELNLGDVVVCNRAHRDEGTSIHYLGSGSAKSLDLMRESSMDQVGAALDEARVEFRCGATWTTDAPYRETWDKVVEYQRKGVLTVEMEAAALLAVSHFRGVSLQPTFVISDRLGAGYWQPGFREKIVARSLVRLLETVCHYANQISRPRPSA